MIRPEAPVGVAGSASHATATKATVAAQMPALFLLATITPTLAFLFGVTIPYQL
jgi:hypothetical protein